MGRLKRSGSRARGWSRIVTENRPPSIFDKPAKCGSGRPKILWRVDIPPQSDWQCHRVIEVEAYTKGEARAEAARLDGRKLPHGCFVTEIVPSD
jgi:hypothetical protein